MPLKHHLQNALLNLKAGNFSAYISALAALGADISADLSVRSIKDLSAKVNESPSPIAQLSPDILLSIQNKWSVEELHQLKFAAAFYASKWSKSDNIDLTYLAKLKLNTSTRHLIHLGMYVVESALNTISANEKVELPEDKINELIGASEKIYQAINSYETKRQKVVRYIANTIAVLSSIGFGLVETGVAVFFMGVLLFSPVGWLALSGLLAGSIVAGSIFSYISYCTLKSDVASLMNEVAGKDRPFQGFLQYTNEEGKTEHFNKKQIASLAIFTALFAIPTAVATGAVGFTSILSIPAIFSLFGVSVAASIFPPIAIAGAVIIAAAMTLFLAKSFHAFIANHHGNLISFLRKPFDDINQIINEKLNPKEKPGANLVAKIAAHALTGLFCVMSVAGLAVSALGGVNSVTAMATRLFKAPPLISAAIGATVGGVVSFAARVIQTITKSSNAIVSLIKLACCKSDDKLDKFGLITGILIDLPLSAFFWMDSFIRPPASSPILPMPNNIKTAALATTCTSIRDMGLVFTSMVKKKQELKVESTTEKNHIVEVANDINLNKHFVKTPAPLQHFSLFKPQPPSSSNEDVLQNDEIAADRLDRSCL